MKKRSLISRIIKRVEGDLFEPLFWLRYRRQAAPFNQRIYLVHIRKTGGTSLNHMFLSLSGENPVAFYEQLGLAKHRRLFRNGKVFVGWHPRFISRGNFFYGFSHIPIHELSLPSDTFTIACFRDPVKRVVSHYNMLMDYKVNKIDNRCMETEGHLVSRDFSHFLDVLPKEQLLNQLYMFSPSFNVQEAVEEVCKLSHFFFTEDFDSGIRILNKKLGFVLESIHIRRSGFQAEISDDELLRLREMLSSEYAFMEQLKSLDRNGD